MAVTYDKISYPLIEEALKNIINDEFQNVYISPKFEMIGNECIRINLLNSTLEESNANYERRIYEVNIRYYFNCDMHQPKVNEAVKNKIDRLKKHLLDNQTKNLSNAKWVWLDVQSIEYNVEDDENDDADALYIAEFTIELINHNQWSA
jgi:hypothetical protein